MKSIKSRPLFAYPVIQHVLGGIRSEHPVLDKFLYVGLRSSFLLEPLVYLGTSLSEYLKGIHLVSVGVVVEDIFLCDFIGFSF